MSKNFISKKRKLRYKYINDCKRVDVLILKFNLSQFSLGANSQAIVRTRRCLGLPICQARNVYSVAWTAVSSQCLCVRLIPPPRSMSDSGRWGGRETGEGVNGLLLGCDLPLIAVMMSAPCRALNNTHAARGRVWTCPHTSTHEIS